MVWTAATAMAVAGCDSSSTSEVTTGPTPPKCQLTVASPTNVVADGGIASITVAAQPECSWTVSTQASWLTDFSPSSGQGNGTVQFRAAPNPVPSMREGEIVVNDSRVRVMQEAAPCRFTLVPETQTVSANASNASVAVSTLNGCAWTARSNAAWLTITSGGEGSGNGTVAFRVASNSGGPRTATLTIADRTHTVNQQHATENPPPPPPPPPPTCTYEINPTSQTAAAAGGALSPVAVTAPASCTWTAVVNNAPWITITSGASGSGNGSVGLTVAANAGAARSGTVTIAGRVFTVTQDAAAPICTYDINPTSQTAAAAGGALSPVAVTAPAGCTWTAVVNNAPWITIMSGASGSGNGSVGLTVAANAGAARSGTVTIASRTFTVTQAAPPPTCTYQISPTSASVAALGGTGSITVTAGTGCAWTATSSASWITLTSGVSGDGNGTVVYLVLPNLGAARSGTISIAGLTFTINQAAPPPSCTYTLNPTGTTVSSSGGTGSFTVTAPSGCAWTAVTTVSWITISSGATGNGNGTVTFTVEPRLGPGRSGTIVAGDQTFTVTQ